ncbi:MAG: 1-acyl-sn-glycerol-3-phosphate acyltransferase [Deltaproteobacteria bacterium]|nr:1-acyl-sn-glycerol-3-phosphate acyltransferase [Deltaproteobacteria bacterium]
MASDPRGFFRLAARVARFYGGTFAELGKLEVARVGASSDERARLTEERRAQWARRMLGVFGIEPRPSGPHVSEGRLYPGRDARGVGRIFLFNHRSGMDILLSLGFFEGTIVSRADLASWPVIGLAARRTGTLFVDRSDARSGATVIQAMARALGAGQGICIYPEGTTFGGDEVRPLKSGAFRAALQAGAELVPVGLAYADSEAAYGDESFAGHMQRVAALPRIVVAVEVGAPIEAVGSADELRARAREALQGCVTRARARLS